MPAGLDAGNIVNMIAFSPERLSSVRGDRGRSDLPVGPDRSTAADIVRADQKRDSARISCTPSPSASTAIAGHWQRGWNRAAVGRDKSRPGEAARRAAGRTRTSARLHLLPLTDNRTELAATKRSGPGLAVGRCGVPLPSEYRGNPRRVECRRLVSRLQSGRAHGGNWWFRPDSADVGNRPDSGRCPRLRAIGGDRIAEDEWRKYVPGVPYRQAC